MTSVEDNPSCSLSYTTHVVLPLFTEFAETCALHYCILDLDKKL